LGKAIELQLVSVMQNPEQQGVARICVGRREEIQQKIFSDGCDGRPNHTSPCDGTANV
jgi:hypothetical protein